MDKRKQKDKKPFSETTTGKILDKAGALIPDIAKMIIPGEVDDQIIDAIVGKTKDAAEADPNNVELQKLAQEVQLAEMAMRREAQQQAHERQIEAIRAETAIAQAEIADLKSARDREVQFMQSNGGKRDWLMGAVVCFTLLLTGVVVYALIYITIPEENQRLADMCFGMILGGFGSVLTYYVGSSRGSSKKDDALLRK